VPPDAAVDRRDQREPERREPRRQHRHRHDHPAQAHLARVLAHQIPVGDRVGAANLDHLALLALEIEHGLEVGDHVLDRDRLHLDARPARRDQHEQPVRQGADDLEGEAAGADDDRRAQLEGLYTRRAQDLADLVPAP
jgi:hypothetical protein